MKFVVSTVSKLETYEDTSKIFGQRFTEESLDRSLVDVLEDALKQEYEDADVSVWIFKNNENNRVYSVKICIPGEKKSKRGTITLTKEYNKWEKMKKKLSDYRGQILYKLFG